MNIQKQILWKLSVACFSIFFGAQAFAEVQMQSLQVSGGIAKPATATAVHSNAAGMVGASSALLFDAGAPTIWNNGNYKVGLQTGASNFGFAAGLASLDSGGSRATEVYYGVAVGTDSVSLGIAGQTAVSGANGTNLNLGTLIKPDSRLTLGATAIGIDHSVTEWGAGVGYAASSGFDLVLDSAFSNSFKNIDFKPGIKLSSGAAALTLAYGTGNSAQFSEDFSAGVGYQFSTGATLQVQYNAGGALSKYYAGLALKL